MRRRGYGKVRRIRLALALLGCALGIAGGDPVARADDLTVVEVSPAPHAVNAPVDAVVEIFLDRAVDPATLSASSLIVSSRSDGLVDGDLALADGGTTVTFTPDAPFVAGDTVHVRLTDGLAALDASTIRSAGFVFRFTIATRSTVPLLWELDSFSTRDSPGVPTRIYGGVASDLNGDRFPDLAIVHEVSNDVRVYPNLADGSGLVGPRLVPSAPTGETPSPSAAVDLDGDGWLDLAIANVEGDDLSILFGNGDGTFASEVRVAVGVRPRTLALIDLDGDGDPDLVTADQVSSQLSLVGNDGDRSFTALPPLETGGVGEYGVAAGDMDLDGLEDLVVGSESSGDLRVLRATGSGFSLVTTRSLGVGVHRVYLEDLDGDGDLDVSAATVGDPGVVIVPGDGAGGLESGWTLPNPPLATAVDLGDLDGDGDLDWVVSNYSDGAWQVFDNDGTGHASSVSELPADANPGCSILADLDLDGDLDVVLLDETRDTVTLMRNGWLIFRDDFESGGLDAWDAPRS